MAGIEIFYAVFFFFGVLVKYVFRCPLSSYFPSDHASPLYQPDARLLEDALTFSVLYRNPLPHSLQPPFVYRSH